MRIAKVDLYDYGFPGYFIRDDGFVEREDGTLLKRSEQGREGRLHVSMVDRFGKRVSVPLHRLVAQVFVPNKYGCSNVLPLNGDRSDVRACNLIWSVSTRNPWRELILDDLYSGYSKEEVAKRHGRGIGTVVKLRNQYRHIVG